MSLRASTGRPRACSGRHVRRRSHDDSRRRVRAYRGDGFVRAARQCILFDLREAEIHQLRVAVLAQHDVLGLDVAVDDARDVRGREGAGHLAGDVDRFAERDGGRRRLQPLAQRLAVDELRHHERLAVHFVHVVDRQD